MKALFGVLVMGSLVGAGSVGVYYAQHNLAPETAQANGQAQAASDETRDLTPVPIPISSPEPQTVSAEGATGNPFAGKTAHSEAEIADRYRTVDDAPVADAAADRYRTADEATSDRVAEDPVSEDGAAIAAEPPADEIPDADQVVGHDATAGDPLPAGAEEAAYHPQRYAAQQAAAVEPAGEPASEAAPEPNEETAGAPRPLSPLAAQQNDDGAAAPKPANPLRGRAAAPEPQPSENDRYAEEEFPAESPAASRYAPIEPQPTAAETGSFSQAASGDGTGRPGDVHLSGSQTPTLAIEKVAPPEIQIGKPAFFVIKVRNTGTVAAHGVEIHDTIPRGTQLLDTSPPAKRGADGTLVWELGTLKPGDEQSAELQLMPTSEGEIGSVATVTFRAEASVRTVATKPMLQIEVIGPSKVNKGEQLMLHITLSNPGSGAASGVTLTENVPQGLKHEEGKELELDIGTLKPGESRELDLALVAAEAGVVTNVITAAGDGKLTAEARTEVEVVAPQLQVALTGPKRRYLERNATHNISITNPGTAPAKDVDLVAVLPRNLKFVEANNGGQFDAASHAVYWSLEELPPKETGTVTLTTLPLEAGEARLLIKSSSKAGLKDEREEVLAIEGLAAINFQLSDLKDPIEIGGETAYEIKVTNQGTKAATNVRLAALVPPGLKAVSAEAPARYRIEGQHVLFEPLKQLAPKADASFTIKVKAVAAGDQRLEVQVATDEIRDPVAKQESTRVFGDE
jgi:uncharacterized repeat protein (TIGR01451 family)